MCILYCLEIRRCVIPLLSKQCKQRMGVTLEANSVLLIAIVLLCHVTIFLLKKDSKYVYLLSVQLHA